MKLLLDTNIIIPMEPTAPTELERNTGPGLALCQLASDGRHQLYVHPEIVADFMRDKDEGRRDLRLQLARRYLTLPEPPSRERIERMLGLSTVSPNDAVDNALLAAVEADAVDYLVTEDAGIHRNARRLGLTDRVLLISTALDLLRDLLGVKGTPPPFVKATKAHSLDPRDRIFESFREDYPGFDAWFAKVRREHRDAWAISNIEGECSAVVIVKGEDGREIGLMGNVLKLCSFKVASHANGTKFGELLLKAVFDHARANHCDAIYVTVFARHAALVVLLRQFGFEPLEEQTPQKEEILVKRLRVDLTVSDALDFHVKFGPGRVLSYADRAGHVVPIRPEFHDALFPDAAIQPVLAGIASPKPYGSAIRKAYLCNATIRKLAAGDNLFFYRSRDAQSVACTGVVEKTLVSQRASEIARFVGVRTVYNFHEIEQLAASGTVLAIMFRHDRTLDLTLTLDELRANKVLNGPPQSIMSISPQGRKWLETRLMSRT